MQEKLGGASSISVSWSNFSIAADSMVMKLCFTKDKIVDRPWRKYKDAINKNKQCWQTAKMAKFFKEGITYAASGSMEVPLPMNTAPSTYSVQVLSKDSTGKYLQYGDSVDTSCKITTTIYNNMPDTLKGTQAFFCVFSIVVLIVAYTYDRSKQA